ncbi:MAG: hypothetical protein QG574_3161 [Cyanobacteriota bacterium erpe_2018_sw_21hr_WHONDRS-SW48-000092_B_bin.40]|jgi:hypothetical protein|nr:hypothetical protein [Cyanobacteriota bacterium erpe_2018_sw_21hr_WHONDRS-SW48-000092_B_bin.40]
MPLNKKHVTSHLVSRALYLNLSTIGLEPLPALFRVLFRARH